jgi:putative (di)nucleoside polyphosphate hydrolase
MIFNPFRKKQAEAALSFAADDLPYRRNVGCVLANRAGQIFVGKRSDQPDPDAGWQMPQGGIDAGETPEQAVMRELYEETSIRQAEIIAAYPRTLYYDFPDELQPHIYGGNFRGQEQYWFLLQFLEDDESIRLAAHDGIAEFSAWAWRSPERVIDLAITFKRPIYERVLTYFEEYLESGKR